MAGAIDIRSFEGGMDTDMATAALPKNKYRYAQNFRLISEEGSNNYIFENSEGNSLSIDLSAYGSSYKIAGHFFIKPYLIVWLTLNEGVVEPTDSTPSNRSRIIRITLDQDLVVDKDAIYIDGSGRGFLNLSTNYPIKAVGYYENPELIKVYWTDGYNEMRWMNIMDSNLSSQKVDEFSILPNFPDVSSIGDVRAELDSVIGGRLKASSIQYTYQYYKINGASTRFAPLSAAIPVPYNNGGHATLRGGEKEEETTIGFKLKINTPASKIFDRIRLVALDFYTYSATPVVRVVGEYKISNENTNTALYFNDIGQTIDEITYEEFLTTGDAVYKAKDIAVKDSILFLGNIEESTFDVDFDARTYRHDNSGVAKLYNSNFSSYIEVNETGTGVDYSWEDVPTEHDAINIYNNPDDETSDEFVYQKDGATLGAEGENVLISFDTDDSLVLDTSNESSKGSISRSSEYIPGHPLNAAYKRSFQRMETYRVGIIFRNDKMQSSSVKWSCDLKMPFWGDTSIGVPFTQNVSGITYANLLGLKVKLKDGVMPDEASSWQVVIAPRRQEDKSVVFNGILQTPGTREIDGVDVLYPESDATSADSSLYTLSTVADVYLTAGGDRGNTPIIISPDINYRDDIEYKSGDFIQGAFKLEYNITSPTYNTSSSDAAQTIYHKLGGVESLTTVANKKDLIDFSIIPQNADSSAYSFINGIQYNNYAYGQGGDVVGLHGTVGVGRTSSTLALSGSTATTDEVPMISYRRNNFNLQYGGIDYYSRQRTEYIAIGEVKYNDNTSVSIFEGDTYIDYFWYLKQSRDVNELNKSYYCTLMFPVESSICPSLDYTRVDRIEAITSETGTFMTESMGTYTGSVGGDDYTFDQTFNLYQYNFSYSVGSFGEYYYDVLLDQSNQTYFPNRIRNSEVKQPGEIEDSFTIFKANNYKDVDGRYGPINNIESFKNKLFFWQDSAFGIAAVNDRSLIQDSSASTLALGSGGILDRIDYISESVGNQNEYGIVLTNKFLYWIDNINNGIYKYSGAEQTLSKTKGIQSWINKNGHIGWGIGEYDQKYNHVLFTFSFSRKLSDVIDLFLVDGYIEYFETISEDSTLDKDGTEYEIVADSVYGDQKIYSKNNTLTYDVANSRWGLGKEIDGDTDSEIYVTIKGDPDKTHTIVFDERNDSFIGFESFEPRVYVKGDGLYMTSVDRSKLYSHGTGKANKGQFYGTYYPSIVTTVFNKDYPHTKVFDTIKWTSESVDSDGKNQFLDTFDEVEFWNDYQHTGDRTLYYQHDAAPATRPTPISRRERTWSMNVPRSIIAEDVDLNPDIFDETNWDSTQTFKERIRDKHLVAKFTYTNDSDDNTFSVPFVSAQYRKSFR